MEKVNDAIGNTDVLAAVSAWSKSGMKTAILKLPWDCRDALKISRHTRINSNFGKTPSVAGRGSAWMRGFG